MPIPTEPIRAKPVNAKSTLRAKNVVRTAISLFIVVLITVSVIGWIWTGTHQPASLAAASHVVLSLGVLAGIVGLMALWRPNPPTAGHGRD
jgi:hypothetical protein